MESNKKTCRFCGRQLTHTFANLGLSPLANDYLSENQVISGQHIVPLHVMVCDNCFLTQALEYEKPENIFSDYKYFSSYSNSWLEHSKNYVDMIVQKLKLNKNSRVIEIASNDGYLLQYFKPYNIEAIGIEPAANVAEIAIKKGINTIVNFFGKELAEYLKNNDRQADLIIGNNVLAHVPYIGDFTAGLKAALKPDGIITMEFPHILNLINNNQFDTIYHEHFSYLSILAVKKVFEENKLKLIDIDELKTHGGSVRIYAAHEENNIYEISENVANILNKERQAGLYDIKTYIDFDDKVKKIKRNILSALIKIKNEGGTIAGYGAAAKGNTLFNYCGIGRDFIDYVVDMNPHKQGMYLPGSAIPIYSAEKIKETKPDYVIIVPWNLKEEIVEQLSYIRSWGGKFISFIPKVDIF